MGSSLGNFLSFLTVIGKLGSIMCLERAILLLIS
ncbi:unnamed protein product [Linum tenue]|uniref:NADH dehydrogenase subunit 4L n=1 Tax=Linum tenue TaxID=586396 RepID=A0AAV0H700_9ROSI|nr:unnamed protein product [Linum tenue]